MEFDRIFGRGPNKHAKFENAKKQLWGSAKESTSVSCKPVWQEAQEIQSLENTPQVEFEEILAEIQPPSKRELLFTEQELSLAMASAATQASLEAEAEHRKSQQYRHDCTVDLIATRISELSSHRIEFKEAARRSVMDILAAMLEVWIPEAINDDSLLTATHLVDDCLTQLEGQTDVVIQVSESQVDAIRVSLSPIIKDQGFENMVDVIGNPNLCDGDVEVRWNDGWATRSKNDLNTMIADRLSRLQTSKPTDMIDEEMETLNE